MATNFKISADMKTKKTPTANFESVRGHRDELRRISAVEKELKRHEAQPMSKAHKK